VRLWQSTAAQGFDRGVVVPRANNRERILDAADALIAADGASSLTTKSVARRAELSEAAIYYHFHDKFDLLLGVLDRHLPPLQAVMRPLAEQPQSRPLPEVVGSACVAISGFWYELFPTLGPALGDSEATHRLGAHLDAHRLGPDRGVTALAAYIRHEMGAGGGRGSVDPEAVARALMGVCIDAAIEGLLSGRSKEAVQSDAARQGVAIVGAAMPQVLEPGRRGKRRRT
jgi:AcrR family transcriptional regulator